MNNVDDELDEIFRQCVKLRDWLQGVIVYAALVTVLLLCAILGRNFPG
jgi:hypothetical protein